MIVVDHAVKRYEDFNLDISLTVPDDTITALVGVNGSGKTTTFRLILGLAKADAGTVQVDGVNSWNMPPSIRASLGEVFSDSGFNPIFTMKNTMDILDSFYPDFDKTRCLKLLEEFQLPLKKRLGTFSTGMLAKAKTILAVCLNARTLLLDEPTAGLDVIARNSVLDLLREYMETPGRSIMISSHNSRDIESLCDDFYYIDHGSIQLHATMEALREDYGVLTLTDAQMEQLDRSYILAACRVMGGWRALTDQRRFYVENMPGLEIGHGDIDELIMLMKQSESQQSTKLPVKGGR